MFAGILFGLDFYLTADRVVYINNNFNIFFSRFVDPYIDKRIFMIASIIYIIVWIIIEVQIIRWFPGFDDASVGKQAGFTFTLLGLIGVTTLLAQLFPYFVLISPRGFTGLIGIILFVLGNSLKLWATYK